MPEGPEIRRAALRLDKVLNGQIAQAVVFGQPHLQHWGQTFTGARVVGVSSRSKAMLTRFDNGYTVYSHNQLYGRWYVTRRGRTPSTQRSLRFAVSTERHDALLYSASDIHVLADDAVAEHPYIARLGPDALDSTTDWRTIYAQLVSPAHRRRRLSALYLDQSFLAGIGNYLRTEILHECGLHPDWRPMDLSRKALGELARASLKITQRAFDTAGITNPRGRVKRLQAEGSKRSAYRFSAFARAGLPCYTCGTPIQRITAGSRRLYLCPTCQARRQA
ncbi:MAG: endonuclease VIII [bacterium]